MKRVYLFVAVFAFALALFAKTAAAAPAHGPAFAPPVIVREETVAAQAWATQCALAGDGSEVCTALTLEVFSPDKAGGTSVCLHATTPLVAAHAEPGAELYEVGCVGIDASQFALGEDFAWASVELVAIDLFASVCDPDTKVCGEEYSRTVVVAGSWSAVAPLVTDEVKDRFTQNTCRVDRKGENSHREMSATIAFDGAEVAGWGVMTASDVTTKTHC